MCDVILIILIFVFVQSPFFNLLVKKKNTVMNIDEYHITLSGYRIKDKVFARLYIERVIEKENEKQDFISVLFSIEDALSYDKSLSFDKASSYIKEKLPNTVSEGINIQATLVAPGINKDLIAKVTIGKKTEILAFFPGER